MARRRSGWRRRDPSVVGAVLAARRIRSDRLLDLSIATLQLVHRRGWARRYRRSNLAALAAVAECVTRLVRGFDWL